MGLIDADVAYKVLSEYYHHKTDIQHKGLREALDRVPSVDAVPVVRCKDCKRKHLVNMVWTCPFGYSYGENFFCGYGL